MLLLFLLCLPATTRAFVQLQKSSPLKRHHLSARTLPLSRHKQSACLPPRKTGSSSAPLYAQAVAASVAAPAEKKKFAVDIPLLLYFFFWYLGNYYYNIANKLALNAAGGAAGFPFTISLLQLVVGAVYACFLWIAPDSRPFPKVNLKDIVKLLPVAFCAAGSHVSSVYTMSAGAVSFGQIVKAAEPAFAAVLGTLFYGKAISKAKWLCLIPVIGGVVLASVKELDFAVAALLSGCLANLFAAVKGNENKKCMETPGLSKRIGSVGNQFALTTILATLMTLPLALASEGHKISQFATLWAENPVVRFNVVASGLYFYGYNELAVMTIKKTSAVTQSVANTAKRVIVIVGVALVLGESLPFLKLLGCAVGIGGVFLYSVADVIWKPRAKDLGGATTLVKPPFLSKESWVGIVPVLGATTLALLTTVPFTVIALIATSVTNVLRFFL